MRHLAVIPTRYEPKRLEALVSIVWREVSALIVMDNGHENLPPFPDTVRVVDTKGVSIYGMWNHAWATAVYEGFDYLTLLNDDVRILPEMLPILAQTLQEQPSFGVAYPDKYVKLDAGLPTERKYDVVRSILPERTLTVFAFCSRVAMFDTPPFDTGYEWWCGDDAFDRKVRAAGFGVARVVGLPIEHESDSEANGWARRPELRHIAQQDLARWNALSR